MVCSPISTIEGFSDLLVYPTSCNYYFWLIIMGGIFVIIAWTMFKEEKDDNKDADMIPALGVSSISITSLAVIGTFIENSSGVPMIQSDILLIMVAVTVVFVMIWIFKD